MVDLRLQGLRKFYEQALTCPSLEKEPQKGKTGVGYASFRVPSGITVAEVKKVVAEYFVSLDVHSQKMPMNAMGSATFFAVDILDG